MALLVAAGGRCASCGTNLARGWHADHINPYARGGETDVYNGQALCRACNLKKGEEVDSVRKKVGAWPADVPLHKWAESKDPRGCVEEFFQIVVEDKVKTNFLVTATPGAGKTRLALRVTFRLFEEGLIERVVVVVPSERLKTQWHVAAGKVGLYLDHGLDNYDGIEAEDLHGMILTNSQAATGLGPDNQRRGCRKPTFAIFDEVHHAGGDSSWGKKLAYAFERSVYQLCLSGTPFRTKGDKIAFVDYVDGKSKADFEFSYSDALLGGINTYLEFPSTDGTMEWWANGEHNKATFEDEVSAGEVSHRLSTALDPASPLLWDMLEKAHDRLTSLRSSTHPSAGGLITCFTQEDARSTARVLQRLTGTNPVVVTSDDNTAQQKIDEFTEGTQPWLVAVKMVSEGVDIPRLRVGVYATKIITWVYFIQFCGRFVRKQADVKDAQHAYIFLPREETLIAYARSIKEMRDHEVKEKIAKEMDDLERDIIEGPQSMWYPIGVEDVRDAEFVFDGQVFPSEDIATARRILDDIPGISQMRDDEALQIIRHLRPDLLGKPSSTSPVQTASHRMLANTKDEKDILRERLHRLVGWIGKQVDPADPGPICKRINAELKGATYGKPPKARSNDELRLCIDIVRRMADQEFHLMDVTQPTQKESWSTVDDATAEDVAGLPTEHTHRPRPLKPVGSVGVEEGR